MIGNSIFPNFKFETMCPADIDAINQAQFKNYEDAIKKLHQTYQHLKVALNNSIQYDLMAMAQTIAGDIVEVQDMISDLEKYAMKQFKDIDPDA